MEETQRERERERERERIYTKCYCNINRISSKSCSHCHRCKKWVQNCRREDLLGQPASYLYANCCICSEHFEPSQFMDPSSKTCRLIWCAVPTIFNVPNPPPKLTTKRALPTRTELPAKKPRKQKKTLPNDTGNYRSYFVLNNHTLVSNTDSE